jgi:tetratricopeptide (TPR) repeat protein
MSSQKPSKWGASKWDVVKAAGALVAKPEQRQAAQKAQAATLAKSEATSTSAKARAETKPRVSVAQPQRSINVGRPLGTASRASAERDARLGRRVIFGVLAIALLVFGTNYAGLWKSPGQLPVSKQPVRKQTERRAEPTKEAPEKQRILPERGKAKEAAPATPAGRPNLAETDCQTTKAATAIIPACSQIIARHPDYADAYAVRGRALRERGQSERALTDFNRALELQPINPEYLAERGDTYTNLRNYDRALADYNKAIELNPLKPRFLIDRGVAYMSLKDYVRAMPDFDRAIEIDPRSAIAFNNRARTFALGKADHARAVADLDRAIEINPRYALALENRGLSHLELKDLPKALADFNRALEVTPRSARALNARGVVYQRQGNRELAIADYRRALEADQNFKTARENLTGLGEKP